MTKIEGVPDGYELVRIGQPQVGETIIDCEGVVTNSRHNWSSVNLPIIRKIEPPKPIEPPEGYRLIEEGVVVGGDLCFTAGWRDSERVGDCIEYLIKNGFAKAYARKIEQQYRPMTRAEFLAAWKQRNFCPLIDPNDDIDVIHRVIIDDSSEDENIVHLYDAGWCCLGELASYKFASDETFLRVEA